ncbi:universal stress protein [Paraburkholderia tropica]|uniref:universal stress protein n=1 Tax=Paraburkholderia tropica TaxID=92647 RepID=UPI002AB76620|nr:universal stress protein [Paraburkholderia tropica]
MSLRICIAIDSSEASREALRFVRDIAPIGSIVRLVSVVLGEASILPPGGATIPVLDSLQEERVREAKRVLANATDYLARAGIRAETQTIELPGRDTDIGLAIVTSAASWQADLLVVGARQHRQWLRWLEGSVSGALTRLHRCPLLIVPLSGAQAEHDRPTRILFAVDSAEDARHCMAYGLRLATRASHLRAVNVAAPAPVWPVAHDAPDVGRATKALVAAKQCLQRASDNVTTATIGAAETSDDIARVLVREAVEWAADLLVMGMHSSGGLTHLVVGSVAKEVARLTRTPLLLVDAPAP